MKGVLSLIGRGVGASLSGGTYFRVSFSLKVLSGLVRAATMLVFWRGVLAAAALAGVGPMAAVAGAMAEWVGRDLRLAPEVERGPDIPGIIVENGGDNVYLPLQAEVLRRSVAALPDDPGGVGLIDHQAGAVTAADLEHLRNRGDVAIHAEDTVDNDQAAVVFGRKAGQSPVESLDALVGEGLDLRPGEAAAVNDAGVVQDVV